MFDWPSFLTSHNIDYVLKIQRRVIHLGCPWCGSGHSDRLLGISTVGKGYHCWRVQGHSGRSNPRLVAALLDCSFEQAKRIVEEGEANIVIADETFSEDVFRQLGFRPELKEAAPSKLDLLPEFKRWVGLGAGLFEKLVLSYLGRRGYDSYQVASLFQRFQLRYSPRGSFAYRIVIPIFMDGRLVNWTGRSFGDDDLRYKSLSTDSERAAAQGLPPALMNVKDCLFDYDSLLDGGEVLVLTEGPFDAMRITFFGERAGIIGTCMFGKLPSAAQLELVAGIKRRFKEVVVLLDADAALDAFLSFPDLRTLHLPGNVKDPALLKLNEFRELLAFAL